MSSLLNVEASFDLAENLYHYEKDLIIIAGPTCVGKSSLTENPTLYLWSAADKKVMLSTHAFETIQNACVTMV